MISANELRAGVTFELDGEAYVVIQFTHIKPGKGSPFVRLKMKNLMTGNIIEQTFRPEEKVKSAYLEHKKMQYLYEADGVYTFMDSQTYEQVALTKADLGDSVNYLLENIVVDVVYFQDKPVSVELPTFIEATITHTEPGIKGDTATGANKTAEIETGYSLMVPLFVNEGDKIRIDTRSGEYLERVK
ncbi:MAG TPA: elongation factor P [Candidatus Cryosericum sp.]|mgnify:FL=1|nr:elongation factor P [Candidatus Cryosericum sp.]HPS69821.1 elongation factor P [Candidatus Cryosericum sp.]